MTRLVVAWVLLVLSVLVSLALIWTPIFWFQHYPTIPVLLFLACILAPMAITGSAMVGVYFAIVRRWDSE
jgi:hypothetical protein